MEIFDLIRLIAGICFLLLGLSIFLTEVFGVFRFKFVMNRMHAAALGDTMGLTFSLVGLMIMSGFNFTTLKMLMVIIFLWVSSPVSSHMLSKLEAVTNDHLDQFCELYEDVESLEKSVDEDNCSQKEGE